MYKREKIIVIIGIISLILNTALVVRNSQIEMTSMIQYEEIYKMITSIGTTLALVPLVIAFIFILLTALFDGYYPGMKIGGLMTWASIYIFSLIPLMALYSTVMPQVQSVEVESINATMVDNDTYLIKSSNFEDFYTDEYNIEYATKHDDKFLMSDMARTSDELLSELNN